MLDQTRLTESSEETVARGLVAHNLLDLSLDEPGQAAQRVRQAFEKWIRSGAFVQVVRDRLAKVNY